MARVDHFDLLEEQIVLGRVYLAPEGINAQVSVPTAELEVFRAALDARGSFAHIPWKIAVEDDGRSFLKLIVRVKRLFRPGLASTNSAISMG